MSFKSVILEAISALLEWLRSLSKGTGGTGQTAAPVPADNTSEPVQVVRPRVLLVVYDPIADPASGRKLSEYRKWGRVESLVSGFMDDIRETSRGAAGYEIVQRIDLREFPAKTDGFRYKVEDYLKVLQGGQPHRPEMADYQAILTGLNILPRVSRREIDEIWVFNFPHAGFYESIMGGSGAFWCNASPLPNTAACQRRFVIMGFSYERGVGEMLEAFGHRAESILAKVWAGRNGDSNLYERFSRCDRTAPGRAEVGSIHFAPNSERDYDWGNQRLVNSRCDAWLKFPSADNTVRIVNASEWGNGDIRLHHKWWLQHLPHTAGRSGGVANNWWQYIMDPNLVDL